MALSTQLSVNVATDQTKTSALATGRTTLSKIYQASLANGTAAGQADLVYHGQRTLAASATEDLDLAGVLSDAFGATLTFVRIKGLIVAANGTSGTPNTNNVIVGAASGSPWAALLSATGTVTLRPGAVFAVVAGATDATGYAVTATSADLLKVANSAGGTSVTYDIVVVGASA